MVSKLARTPVTWLTYIQLGLYCYYLYAFGPVVALLRDEQGVSNTLASLHTTTMALGAMGGGWVFPLLAKRFGRPRVLWGCLAGIALGVLGFVALPPWYPLTLFLSGFVAVCGIALVSGVVVSLSQAHGAAGPAAISEANAIACFAGLVSPLVVGATIAAGWGWRAGLGVLIGLIGLAALAAWVLKIHVPQGQAASTGVSARGPLGRAYWITWWMIVMTGVVEIVLGLWSAIVLRERLGFSAAAAAAAVSAILGGMMVGRAAGARIALRAKPLPLYFSALAISAVGFGLFWTAPVPTLAVAGLFVAGLGNAMHYPLGISMALAAAPRQPERAAGVVSYSMGLSFGIGPLLLGLVADGVGTHRALLLVPVFIVAAALLAWRLAATPKAASPEAALPEGALPDAALPDAALPA
ncbi:MAG TPA: MFS transporter [Candidatus Limnocylindrales bacterium]|nr:MFS transporter [Candidatus Limnocylindrales bacterium]